MLMFALITEVKLFEYKQSILAASALLCAAHELVPQQFSFFLDAVSKWEHINKVRFSFIHHFSFNFLMCCLCLGLKLCKTGEESI